ncbi:TIGR01620 family protein [Erwinia sp. HDF1-3R]|uniref:TIGR01620 family protein n=1 Tax=Erwinia sp. HDF1-3R TaxID=3141543 RepID=UPI0031F4A3FF
MTTPLKPRIDFTPTTGAEKDPAAGFQPDASAADRASVLQPARAFEPGISTFTVQEPLSEPEEESAGEQVVEAALRPRRSLWRKMVRVGLGIFAVSLVAQGAQWAHTAWLQQDWVAMGGCVAGGMIVLAGIGSLVTEWRRLYRLRERAEERDVARDLLASHGIGKGRDFCERLARQAGLTRQHPALQRWRGALHETNNDREIVGLYARMVQPELDRQARREIGRSAAESTLMIAVSPLALVDMTFIAWRNLRLVNRIATLYGIELGYFSRLRLFRLVLLNIAFAGASELVREVGMDWMSQDLAARFSARAAQGIGAGLLTARLGIKTMELCRPLPWMAGDKPRLGDFRRDLITELKETLRRNPEK